MSEPIASYSFLPWLRRGMASQIRSLDSFGTPSGVLLRSRLRLTVDVNGQLVPNDVELVGPGDLNGFNRNAIIRTEPRHWVTDFEPNYLAFIEFYDEDYPWRYTPARASATDRLRPWLFLLALEEDEFADLRLAQAPLDAIQLQNPASLFPDPAQIWAWAHVHANRDITGRRTHSAAQTAESLRELVSENPDTAFSRLLCPRKLKPQTAYHAFLIPAFETGRRAGLGQDPSTVDAQLPSWGNGQTDYPVYYRWYFRTGERGDFEYLVNLLEPRPVDEQVGIRDMDMTRGSFGVDGMNDPKNMGLEGALKKPGAQPRPGKWPPDGSTPPFLDQLRNMVNLPYRLLQAGHPDPVVSPPLYGRWHARVETMDPGATGWVNELNRDPRLRVPAGYGGEVIRTGQEDYMKRAWQQLGDVLAANQKIRQAQLALATMQRSFQRNLKTLRSGDFIPMTRSVHGRVMGSSTTIAYQVRHSPLTRAGTHPTLRRLLRERGPVMRKAIPEGRRKTARMVEKIAKGSILAAPEKQAPGGQVDLGKLPASRLPLWLLALLRSTLLRRVLPVLVALLILTVGYTGSVWALAGAIAGAAGLVSAEVLRRRAIQPGPFDEAGFTPETATGIPPNPAFSLTRPGTAKPPISPATGTDSPEAARFRSALTDLFERFALDLPREPTPVALDLDEAKKKILAAINPVAAIPKRVLSIIALPGNVKRSKRTKTITIVPVMAHPVFSDPMYEGLRDISSELLIPNLNLIPNNTISLLETNRKFIESYMVGVNHEMGRELLWREYPTDQRGSYFRQFWDIGDTVSQDDVKTGDEREEELKDIKPIHTWGRLTELGSHENRVLPTGSEEGDARIVLVIRGDLLKKYPGAVIYARKAMWIEPDHSTAFGPSRIRVLADSDPARDTQYPIFKAEIHPDIKFLGFNLTQSIVRGNADPDADDPGWFFVIQERPGEPRFGLDIQDDTPSPPSRWSDLAWNHLGDPAGINYIDLDTAQGMSIKDDPDHSVVWGSNAADMGYILYQAPSMVAFHAADMLDLK